MQTAHESQLTALIVLGGFAGTGKTTHSRRLSSEFRIPRLGSDTIGRTIRNSRGIEQSDAVNAYWVAYDVLFRLCEEFIQAGVSTVLDLSMGWAFQWERLDTIRERHPEIRFLPIVLRCPKDICIERTRIRHNANPTYYDPPETYLNDPKLLAVWEYLDRLDRPEVYFVDAAKPEHGVYEEIKRRVVGN